MKQISAILLFCLLIATMSGAQNNQLYFSPEETTINLGEITTITVSTNMPLSAFEFIPGYNQVGLELIHAAPGNEWELLPWAHNIYVSGAVIVNGEPGLAQGELAKLTFKGVMPGIYEVQLHELLIYDDKGMDITPENPSPNPTYIYPAYITVITDQPTTGKPALVKNNQ